MRCPKRRYWVMWIWMLLIGGGLALWAIPKIRRIGFYAFAMAVGVLVIDIWKAVARLFSADDKIDYHAIADGLRIAEEYQQLSDESSRIDS